MNKPDIFIAGGGIAGLTLALASHDAGYRPRVFESSASLGELGVGINVLPHAAKQYERLGVLDALLVEGVELQRYMWFNRHGQEIWREARGRQAGYQWPQVSIHRGSFHRVLAAAVRARLGADAIVLDHHLRGFTQTADKVTAQFTRHSGGALCAEVECDVLIGADGAPPPEREDWNRSADIAEFIDHFRDFRFDWLDVPALARASGPAYALPMVDRDPLPRWTHGRVTLLGDAAHPMWPIGSNGASQAVLDSRALVDQLTLHADPRDALLAYEALRRPATAALVTANRSRAHDDVLDLCETRAPHGFSDARTVISAAEIEASLAKYKQTAQFDKSQLQK